MNLIGKEGHSCQLKLVTFQNREDKDEIRELLHDYKFAKEDRLSSGDIRRRRNLQGEGVRIILDDN
jgi:hypothetical protein